MNKKIKYIVLSFCAPVLLSCANVVETKKLSITPTVVNAANEVFNYTYKQSVALTSDKSGNIYLKIDNKKHTSVTIKNLKFVTSSDRCEFEFNKPVPIHLNESSFIKIANKKQFEMCHPIFKGYDFLSTNGEISIKNGAVRRKDIATTVKWQSQNKTGETHLGTTVYFIL